MKELYQWCHGCLLGVILCKATDSRGRDCPTADKTRHSNTTWSFWGRLQEVPETNIFKYCPIEMNSDFFTYMVFVLVTFGFFVISSLLFKYEFVLLCSLYLSSWHTGLIHPLYPFSYWKKRCFRASGLLSDSAVLMPFTCINLLFLDVQCADEDLSPSEI